MHNHVGAVRYERAFIIRRELLPNITLVGIAREGCPVAHPWPIPKFLRIIGRTIACAITQMEPRERARAAGKEQWLVAYAHVPVLVQACATTGVAIDRSSLRRIYRHAEQRAGVVAQFTFWCTQIEVGTTGEIEQMPILDIVARQAPVGITANRRVSAENLARGRGHALAANGEGRDSSGGIVTDDHAVRGPISVQDASGVYELGHDRRYGCDQA